MYKAPIIFFNDGVKQKPSTFQAATYHQDLTYVYQDSFLPVAATIRDWNFLP